MAWSLTCKCSTAALAPVSPEFGARGLLTSGISDMSRWSVRCHGTALLVGRVASVAVAQKAEQFHPGVNEKLGCSMSSYTYRALATHSGRLGQGPVHKQPIASCLAENCNKALKRLQAKPSGWFWPYLSTACSS